MCPEAVAVSETTIHLNSGLKLFAAECAVVSACRQLQGTAHRPGVSKFPGCVGEILFRDDIFADVPAAKVAAQDKLQLHLALFLSASLRVGIDEIVLAVVSDHFS